MKKREIVVEKSEDEEKIEEIDIRKCKFSTYGGDPFRVLFWLKWNPENS